MSLRMNLYGWSLDTFLNVLGSKNASVLKAASAHVAKAYSDRPEEAKKAIAWLRKLINTRVPLKRDRKPPTDPTNGGLMVVRMETGLHAVALDSMVRALMCEDYLNLATDSSSYTHPCIRTLWDDFSACRFTHSKDCPWQIHQWMADLAGGTPLFGDGFRTDWSYYTIFTNADLAMMVPVFRAAARFKWKVPKSVPKKYRERLRLTLSEGGKRFIAKLITWFGQIEKAGQDAYIIWW